MHLHDWEAILAPHLSKIELLSEIPLDRNGHAQLEQDLSAFIQLHGLTDSTRRLRQEYPAVFVTYLAFKAARNEERGFWEGVAAAAGATETQTLFSQNHHWGKTFIEIIEQYPNLRRFDGISGYEYLTPIRLHGGIPAYSLPDFFQHILLPSVEKAPYDGMDDESALKSLLEHYTAQLFVDDVVRHFFRNAGESARKFFAKCRHMARLAQTNQPLPTSAELGLRPYVVQFFETYQQEKIAPSLRRRRPRLHFYPYGPSFHIILPPQPLSLEQAGKRYNARLYEATNGAIYAEQNRLRPRRQAQEWLMEEIEWMLDEPLESVQAGIFAESDEIALFSYPLRLLPPLGYPPLLAFRYEDNRQVPISPALPACIVWLFFPADVELLFGGTPRQVESLQPFAPPWQTWQAVAYDLTAVTQIRLFRNGQDVCPPVSVLHSLEPGLTPSNLSSHILAVDDKPIYNVTPQVCLPFQTPEAPQSELENWSLQLESRYAANPQGNWQAKASELPFSFEDSEVRISLIPWLGESPVGTYHLNIQHRGRLVSELPFRVCAGFEVHGLQPYYLPGKNGAEEVAFFVHVPDKAHLLAEDDSRSDRLQKTNKFRVKVPEQASQADLYIELTDTPEPIRIPLRVIIPRLRWALTLDKGAALKWAHQPVARPLAELLQTDLARSHPRLRVELPLIIAEKPLVGLHLGTPGRTQPWQISRSLIFSGHWLEFNLSEFFDTLRTHPQESIFEFYLELLDTHQNLNLSLPVLRFSRELDIFLCYSEATPSGGWRIHWEETHPLRHRRLRLWSLWQPWADPIEIPLPDDTQPSHSVLTEGWWMYEIPQEISLPASTYCAHFVAVSPYENNPVQQFPPDQAIELEMIKPEERLAQIEHELSESNNSRIFLLHFEMLCIYHTSDRQSDKQEEIRWCLSHWQSANLIHLEALSRWLGIYDCAQNRSAFLIHLFREENLKQLEEGRYPSQFVAKYLLNITDARTLNPASARRILRLSNEPAVLLHVLKLLIKLAAEEARSTFWESLEQGRFSERDAALILKDSPQFTRQLLANVSSSPLRTRLLFELSRYLDLPEHLVKIDYFVLCDAGWGKLLEIQGTQRETYFFPGEESPTLLVELIHWPEQRVKIQLATKRMTLLERSGINRCSCGRFVALGGAQTRETWMEHQAYCGRTDKSYLPATITFEHPLLYRASAPENPLDTRFGE